MRSPRLIYLAVAVVLAVAGFALTQYVAGRSSPGLGDTVVVPAGSSASVPPPTTATPSKPGADPVTPGSPRTAGDDDDRDDDGIDDDLDDDD
ncbi:hypothetical protein [Kribbella lupini]